MPDSKPLPDWWQRERQRRNNWVLIFLILLLGLIGYYYWVSAYGVIGAQPGVTFDTSNYLAFIHVDEKGNSSLYAVRADGTDLRRLTPEGDKSNKQDPSWTLDGKSLLYSSTNNKNQVMQVYLMGDGIAKQMTYGTGNKFSPTAVAGSQMVSFLSQGAVKTVLMNGEDVHQVMPPPHAGHDDGKEEGAPEAGELRGPYLWAQYSPNGELLAAIQSLSSEDNPHNLGIYSPGDQVLRVLLKGKSEIFDSGREMSAHWEPKGKRLLCSFAEYHIPKDMKPKELKDVEFLSGLKLWNFEGAKPDYKNIFVSVDYTLEPRNISWSPDGNLVAMEIWYHKKGGDKVLKGIAVLDISKDISFSIKTEKEALDFPTMLMADKTGSPQRPVFSQDGSRLLYEMVKPEGGRDIWVANLDGTSRKNLTATLKGDNAQAIWAPLKK